MWNYWSPLQHISNWNTSEKRKLEKCFLGARVWAPKPVYWSPKWPEYIMTDETFQQSGKQDSLRCKLKSSSSMYASSDSQFFEKCHWQIKVCYDLRCSANNFALSVAEDNTSRLLNRGGIADSPLQRTLLAICQRSCIHSSLRVSQTGRLLINSLYPGGGTNVAKSLDFKLSESLTMRSPWPFVPNYP